MSMTVESSSGVTGAAAAAAQEMLREFEERLGTRFVGAGLGGSSACDVGDGFADIDVVVFTRGARERWRIPSAGGVFDVFVVDIERIDLSGQSSDFDHIVRLLAGLQVLHDPNGTVAMLAGLARARLAKARPASGTPPFAPYAIVFDLQRKLRRAVSQRDLVGSRLRSVLLVWNAAKLLIAEHGAWLDSDYLRVLEGLDRSAAQLARQALLEADPLAAARKALIFSGHVLRRRPGIENATLWRRTS